MTTKQGPPCPLCGPARRMHPHGTGWLCVGCSNSWTADQADDDVDPPTEVLMRPPVTPKPGGGSSGSRTRRAEKPGEREARKRRRRWEQEGGGAPVGKPERPRPERVVAQKVWSARLTDDGRMMLDVALEVLNADLLEEDRVTESGVARMALHALHLRITSEGAVPCWLCRFPRLARERQCGFCGAPDERPEGGAS